MIGLGVGGVWGLADGIRNREVVGSSRLRATTIINGITRRGPFLANTSAVLGEWCSEYHNYYDVYRTYCLKFSAKVVMISEV